MTFFYIIFALGYNKLTNRNTMYYFTDNWYGDVHCCNTLADAKREAKKHTYGHSIAIYRDAEIVSVIRPKENPLP